MVERFLPTAQFNNVIHWIATADASRLTAINCVTTLGITRLGLKSLGRRAVSGDPGGSDQFDLGSLKTWIEAIAPEDRQSIDQLLAIDATVKARKG
jgi:hypothetical protein